MILFQNNYIMGKIMIQIIRENKILYTLIALTLLFIVVVNLPKYYSNDFYKEYENKTNKEMQSLYDELEGIAFSFVQDTKINEEYKATMHDCIGFLIYKNDENKLLKSTLEECNNDYKNKDSNIVYYNEAWLRKDFSHWNGSYLPLERIIQKHIKENKSYEHLKTTASIHFLDERPHMFVSIDFRAANMTGYMLNRTMEAKIDAKTKEVYDLK